LKSITDYSEYNHDEFISFILNNEIVGFYDTPIRLTSGKLSNWFINWREATEDVFLVDQMSDFVIRFLLDNNLNPDCLYGIPEGGTKLALITQFKWANLSKNYQKGSHILPMGRGLSKKHGPLHSREYIGRPRGKTIILEDVVTTGRTLLKKMRLLRKRDDINISGVIVLSDRAVRNRDKNRVKDLVESMGIPYYALSDAFELVPKAFKHYHASDEMKSKLEKEFEQNYKENTIKLSH
jgi:orotate phosphoribosyltransferase